MEIELFWTSYIFVYNAQKIFIQKDCRCILCESAPNDARVGVGGNVSIGRIRHRRGASFLLHVGVIPEELIET